jgi:hypothetical protein
MLFIPLKILLSPMVLPVLIFAGGFAVFKTAPACGPIGDDARMFVLTGDPRRIPFALDKLDGHPDRRLYVIGAGTPVIESRQRPKVKIESASRSTHENAIAIRRISQEEKLASIILITSVDHMTRAAFLVRRQIPGTEVILCPVPLSNMPAPKRLERWITEYIKFIGTIFGIHARA